MKQLKTLIKYRKNVLDEKRRELKQLREQEDQIVFTVSSLKNQLQREGELVASKVDVGFSYGDYAKANKSRREELLSALEELREQIEVKEEELSDAYRELKKYEITLERREAEEKQELERKEQVVADENASNQWRRQNKPS